MADYGDLIRGLLTVDQDWKDEQNDRLLARLLMASLFQEAVAATTAARANGTKIDLKERVTTDGFELVLHPDAVEFVRTNKGVDIRVTGRPRLGLDHTLMPECSFEGMRAQAINEMRAALEYLL